MDKYIRKINPDYVLVLYLGVNTIGGSLGKYDFMGVSRASD